jgi:hypothetical protein
MLFEYAELASTDASLPFDTLLEVDFPPGTDRLLHENLPSAIRLVDAGTPGVQLAPFCGTRPWLLIVCFPARQDIDDKDHQPCAFYDQAIVTCHDTK